MKPTHTCPNADVIENTALGKTFWYCRGCKEELISLKVDFGPGGYPGPLQKSLETPYPATAIHPMNYDPTLPAPYTMMCVTCGWTCDPNKPAGAPPTCTPLTQGRHPTFAAAAQAQNIRINSGIIYVPANCPDCSAVWAGNDTTPWPKTALHMICNQCACRWTPA